MIMKNNPLLPSAASDGFWVGAISTLVASGINQMQKVQKGETTAQEAMVTSSKHALNGGIALGTAAQATSFINSKNMLGAFGTVLVGGAALYAVEKVSQKIKEGETEECTAE